MLAQRLALDERHGVVRHAVAVAGGEHGDDVGLLQPRGELDLAVEALGADVGCELGGEDFDDDEAIEPDLAGEEDARHAAAAELALDGVGAADRLERWSRRGSNVGRALLEGRGIRGRNYSCFASHATGGPGPGLSLAGTGRYIS